jgi:hypothetical protein
MRSDVRKPAGRSRPYFMGLALGAALIVLAWSLLRQTVASLASRPEVAHVFHDPRQGVIDAWVSLIGFILLLPVVALLLIWVLYLFPAGLILPLGRRVGVPEPVSMICVMALSTAIVYSQRDVWMGPSLHCLAIVARAWMTILQ